MMMNLLRHLRLLPAASILIWLTAAVISVAWSPGQLAFLHPSHRRLPNRVHLSPSLSCPRGDAGHQSIAHHSRFLSSLTPHFSSQNSAQSNDNVPQPPLAFRNESSFLLAGDLGIHTHGPPRQSPSSPHPLLSPPRSIPDPYAWLRDDARTNTTVLSHLHAENQYTRLMTQHLDSTRQTLYQEFLSGMHETDCTTPMADGAYWYYTRYEKGVSYPRYCRAPRKMEDLYPPAVVAVGDDPEVPLLLLLPGEEVYLDVTSIAQEETYLAVGAISVSPNQMYVAYSVDATGGEICQFHVKHIASGKEWVLYDQDGDDESDNTLLEGYGAIVWDEESMGIFYATMDETHRPYRVYYRRLFRFDGSYINESERPMDELLLEEDDKLFSVHIEKTLDGKYLLISCSSSESSEVHYLDLNSRVTDGPMASNLVCIAQRRNEVLYRVTHCKGYWLVQTNLGGLPNFSLKACPVGEEFNGDTWKDVVLLSTGNAVFDGGHEKSLDGVRVYDPPPENSHGLSSPFAFCVASGREDGLPRVWILELGKEDEQVGPCSESNSLVVTKITRLEFTETPFHVSVGDNRDPTLPYVVVEYDSLVTPLSHVAVPLSNPMELDARKVLKEKEVPGYEKDLYSCERTTVKSRDGKSEIPISVVFRRDAVSRQTGNKGGVPTHIYGYGSYGSSIEASFRATRLPLLNRGVVFVIAHVRGGGEMGRPWYEHAKCLSKMNSFNDFVDVARWLTGDNVESSGVASASDSGNPDWYGITSASKLSCEGRSAGGLLIGAAINQAPHLFRVAILGVPFVDVLCTMVDSTLPLTIAEWEEWGNPNEERYFQYIEGYSPINNVRHGEMYPACLLTGGLYDPRVQYWEPAKFAAELRHGVSKDSGKVLLKIDMDAGHFSGHDRYKYLRELSFDYAFLLDELGLV